MVNTALLEDEFLEVNTEWGIVLIQVLNNIDDVPREGDFDLVIKSKGNRFWLINLKPHDDTLRDFDILLKTETTEGKCL